MEKRDIRLYHYSSGKLVKLGRGKNSHNFSSVQEAKQYALRFNTRFGKGSGYQWVITEYFANYDSKILEVL